MKVEDYPAIKRLNNLASLLPDNKSRSVLYEICGSLVVIGAGLGAMLGLAEVVSPFSTSKELLEKSASELQELKDFLANGVKKFV